ncbi:MAG: sigma-70 family RNA polymerase sigma factor [Acidobacteriota bacterium]|nr:sigma-70 family RNA polymerase sigma factor [Acidobacteriota bacterium]
MHHSNTLTLSTGTSYADLVSRIQARHPTGLEELYGLARNFSFFLMRQLGSEDLTDKVHDVFVTVAQAIASGKLRDPERLIPFLTTVTRYYTYGQIERRGLLRRCAGSLEGVNPPDPRVNLEQSAWQQQRLSIVEEVLARMPRRDRDILRRFYLEEQSKEQICREMKLTANQFRLLKSKAKLSFARLGTRRLKRHRLAA